MSNPLQVVVDNPADAAIHTTAMATVLASIAGWLPVVLALIPAVYYFILIWESRTVQHWLGNRRMKRAARKLAKLKAAKLVIEAELQAAETLRNARVQAREALATAKHDAIIVAAEAEAGKAS